jgi:hypothetical protein
LNRFVLYDMLQSHLKDINDNGTQTDETHERKRDEG